MTRLIVLALLLPQVAWAGGASMCPTGWSADGSNIVVAAKLSDGYGVYVFDTEGRKQSFISFPHTILSIKWPGKDQNIMCILARQSDGRSYIWIANPTGIVKRLSDRAVYVGKNPSENLFDCSPDAQYVVYASGTGSDVDLWRIDTETGRETRLTDSRGRDFSPAWSRNGRSIAFCSERGSTCGIWVMSADGGPARKLVDGPESEQHPSWAPDGSAVAYLVKGTKEGIYSIPISGGKSRPIAIGGRGYAAPTWSSTGKWISFIYGSPPANIFCTSASKAKGWGPYYETTFDRTPGTNTDLRVPVWSPTADQQVFTTFETGKMSIRLANMSTTFGAAWRDVYPATGHYALEESGK